MDLSKKSDTEVLRNHERFLPGVPGAEIEKILNSAPGREIATGKFDSQESSAALAVNTFGFFLKRPQDLPPLPKCSDVGWPARSLSLETTVRFPWRGGRHPVLDVLVTTSSALIGIEAKRFEPFRSNHRPSFSDTYLRREWGDRMGGYEAIRDEVRKGKNTYRFLDAAQLVKHALALRSEVHRDDANLSPVLYYVYAEPKHWPCGEEIDQKKVRKHEVEIRRFGQAVRDNEVSFLACSYRDLLRQWKTQCNRAIADHADEVFLRFEPWGKISGLKLGWGDAQVWMDTATHLYMRNVENGLLQERLKYPQLSELNVACVCAGYAFEILYKILVQVGWGTPEPKHPPRLAHQKLIQKDQDEVERILAKHGWPDPDEFLTFLDEDFCNPSRKYWMQNKDYTGTQHGGFPEGGRKVMVALQGLHRELSEWALRRIEEQPWEEI